MKFLRRIGASVADVARYVALAASMLISYAVERELALSHGVPEAVAPAVPVAVDLFLVWAVRVRRDVALAVALAVAANVAGVLTAENLSAADTWVSAALHAVFPLTLWRMHRSESAPSAQVSEPVSRPNAPAITPRPAASEWPSEDLWQDFTGHAPDSEEEPPATPPTAEDLRAAIDVLASRHGRPVTGTLLASHFGVSERTGRRYLAMTV